MRARRLLGLTVNPLPILGAKARRGLSACGLNGKTRMRKGRMAMQWDVTGAPLQDVMVVGGEYPYCDKAVPEDTWLQGG